MKAAEAIRKHLRKLPVGEPFTPARLLGLGTRASVDQTLSRLVKTGEIARVTRGVFVRPASSRHIGKVMPEPSKVAKALATAKGATLGVHGAEAARHLQLTTQAPIQPVFCTSGPSKRFQMGKMDVVLKHTAARKLALAGRPSGLALSALWYLGKNEVQPHTIELIRQKLSPTEFEALKSAKASMPGWMTEVFYRYEHQWKRRTNGRGVRKPRR